MGYQPEKKYYNFNNKFYYILIYIIAFFNYSETRNIKLTFISNKSLIKILFVNKGKNRYLSKYFNFKPSSVIFSESNYCDNSSICDILEEKQAISLNFDNIVINSCENMFKGLSNIKQIDLSEFNSSQVISMAHMFEGCSNLISIIFEKMGSSKVIDTSKVKNMEYLFYGCSKLQNLNLYNFDTSSVTNMRYMFAFLFELIYLNINFNTSNVINMAYMFYHVSSLKLIHLIRFNTSQVKNMSNMFSDMWKF